MRGMRRSISILLVGLVGVGVAFGIGQQETTAEPALSQKRFNCSPDLKHRTPTEVIENHVALIGAGNLDQAMCDYAPDATVILPGQIIRGVDQIRAALLGFQQLFGGATPTVVSITADGPVVLLTFFVFGSEFSIPDGADTYVIEKGAIRFQTVHDTIVPSAP